MKQTILFLLVAVTSSLSVHAQETRKAIYVIDGKQVENFDGSQLTGKTIVSYIIDAEHNLHQVITSDMTGGKEVKSVKILSATRDVKADASAISGATTDVIRAEADEVIYVLDGKVALYPEIQALPSAGIESMTVIKDKGNPIFKKYADEHIKTHKKAPACVIFISTGK